MYGVRKCSSFILLQVVDFLHPIFINGQIIQKINKETQALNDTVEQIILIDVYRALHSKVAENHILLKWTWKIIQDWPHWATRWALVNFKKLKSYQASFLSKMQWN